MEPGTVIESGRGRYDLARARSRARERMASTGIGEDWCCSGIELVALLGGIELVAHPRRALLGGMMLWPRSASSPGSYSGASSWWSFPAHPHRALIGHRTGWAPMVEAHIRAAHIEPRRASGLDQSQECSRAGFVGNEPVTSVSNTSSLYDLLRQYFKFSRCLVYLWIMPGVDIAAQLANCKSEFLSICGQAMKVLYIA